MSFSTWTCIQVIKKKLGKKSRSNSNLADKRGRDENGKLTRWKTGDVFFSLHWPPPSPLPPFQSRLPKTIRNHNFSSRETFSLHWPPPTPPSPKSIQVFFVSLVCPRWKRTFTHANNNPKSQPLPKTIRITIFYHGQYLPTCSKCLSHYPHKLSYAKSVYSSDTPLAWVHVHWLYPNPCHRSRKWQWKTLRLVMMHHYTKFGCKRLKNYGNMEEETVIFWGSDLALWPWPWR